METPNFKIAQITDFHLMSQRAAEFKGMCSYKNLAETINVVLERNYNLVIATGDISEDGSIESYRLVHELTSNKSIPFYFIPGNHDSEKNMKAVLSNRVLCEKNSIRFLNWKLLYINTNLNGYEHGHITNVSFDSLINKIDGSTSENIGLIMHHHPIKVETPLMDQFNIKNSDPLNELVREAQKIKVLIFGHVHNDYEFYQNNTLYSSSPATCLQIRKGATTLEIDYKFGFKEYFFSDNKVKTNTVWI